MKRIKDAWEMGMTFSKVESWPELPLFHKVASEMLRGLRQGGACYLPSTRIVKADGSKTHTE